MAPTRQRGGDPTTLPAPTAAATPAAPAGRRGLPWAVPLTLAGWMGATAVACLIVRMPGIVPRGNETTLDRAVFTAVNAATLTGFQQTMGVREMAAAGPGGPALLLGLTILGTFASLFVGGLAAARALRMPHGVGQIAWAAMTAQLLATVAGAAALTSPTNDVFPALVQSASACGNSGLWLGSFQTPTSPAALGVLLPLAVLGGLGLPVLIELANWVFGRATLSRHSRVVLTLSAGAYLGGLLILVLAQLPAAGAAGGWGAWRSTLASCTAASVDARTAGIPLQSPAAFTAAGQWVLIALMAVGAAPAGTAGGMKVTTLWHLGRGTRAALAGRTAGRVFGIAAVWAAFYLACLFVGILLLVGVESQMPADRLVFMAVSALSNVGLSHDPVSMTGAGLLVLSGLMLVGRLAPLAVLWWVALAADDADVLVG